MSKTKIFVVGASGTVGSELVKILNSNNEVEVISATSKKATKENQVHIDLVSGEGLSRAFSGIDRAFFLCPPGYADQYKLLSPLIKEAKKNKLKKVVLMTAMGANAVETAPLRRAELELIQSGLEFNIIRPNWFMQNFNTFWIKGILEQGKIFLPAKTAKTSFIDARDIAAVAAELLLNDKLNNKEFDITGPESLDHDQVAEELSRVTGKKIQYQQISVEDFKAGLLSAGIPVDYADFLVMIMGFLAEGYSERTTTSVQEILKRAPRSFKDYARDYKNSWP